MVVLACSSFHDPLARSLAVDLERRGYIVFITVSSTEEDSLVQQEAKEDIRPLWMDLTSSVPNPAVDIHPNLESIKQLITDNDIHGAGNRSKPHALFFSEANHILAGLVVLPGSTGYPEGQLLGLQTSDLVDTLNTRMISPIITIQQFLPLLKNHSSESWPSSVIFAYPSIPSTLSPPYQTSEILTTAAIPAFIKSLRRELRLCETHIRIGELRLGNFDLGTTSQTRSRERAGYVYPEDHDSREAKSALVAQSHWHSEQRAAAQRRSFGQISLIRGAPLRNFHNSVFDILAMPSTSKAFGVLDWTTGYNKPNVIYVGSGAYGYHLIQQIAPDSLVGWLMGYRLRTSNRGQEASPTVRSVPSQPWRSASADSESNIWEKV